MVCSCLCILAVLPLSSLTGLTSQRFQPEKKKQPTESTKSTSIYLHLKMKKSTLLWMTWGGELENKMKGASGREKE